jgi:multicomponent Na+:H+ antiporter subunit D
MADQAPILVIIFPLIFAFVTPLLGWWKKDLCYPWVLMGLSLSTIFSIITLKEVLNAGVIHYHLGGWDPPWGIEYVIDHLNSFILVLVASISLLVAISSKRLVEEENPDKVVYFYTLFLLQVTGFLGIVATGDLFNLYVFLEIASLAGYALIAVGEEHAPFAAFRYLIMGTIGACFYLLGVGYLYMATGSLNMADLSQILPNLYHSKVVMVALIFFLVGVAIKMALFPLHAWLPDAYTYAPSTTSALVAPLMTKVSVYVMIRIIYTVFKPYYSIETLPINSILCWVAVIAILYGVIMALRQVDLKRMFCYILIAETGYMVGGVGLANRLGITGAILHIMNDALMIACLFLVAGAVVYKLGGHNINQLKDAFKKMPFSMAAFAVVGLSLIGVPPTCGFFSKWYLILGAIEAESWTFIVALLLSSAVNAILFFKIVEIAYYKEASHAHNGDSHGGNTIDEAPVSILIPLGIVALAIILAGIFSGKIVSGIIQFAVPPNL